QRTEMEATKVPQKHHHTLINKLVALPTFGDSISDGGFAGPITRFLSGYDSKLYNELISEAYTGETSPPYTQGGTNYAQSGATASQTPFLIYKTSQQIDMYLQDNNQQGNPDGLYILWVGANDLSVDVETSLLSFNFSKIFNQGENYLLSSAPQDVVSQARRLLDSGAGMVVVPNLPDAGMSPWTGTALFGFAQAFLGGNLLDLPRLYALQDAYLRSLGSVNGEEARQAAVTASVERVLESYGLNVPIEITSAIFRTFLSMENKLTEQFNNDVEKGLSGLQGNIVLADVNRLFAEIIDSPAAYGFDNILVPMCQIGIGAPFCKEDTPGFYNDQVYLFSDWFHPSPVAHGVIAEYMMSIIDAPFQVAGLNQGINNIQSDRRLYLDSQLQKQRMMSSDDKVSIFGGYSGKYARAKENTLLTGGHGLASNGHIGFSLQPVKGFSLGGMVSAGNTHFKSSDLFKYQYNSTTMSLFSQLVMENGVWGNLELSSGSADFNKIRRSVSLGKAVRTEQAATRARFSGLSVNLGFDMALHRNVTTGPLLGFSYDRSLLNGYAEKGNSSTSMKFGDQRLNRRNITAGWRIDTRNLPVNPYLHLSYRNESVTAPGKITASLKSTGTEFYRLTEGGKSRQWREVKLGMYSSLSKNLSTYAAVQLSNSNDSNTVVNYATGLNYSF
ncbi:autotransporter domain-containing protein, partial [Tatumella sp. JGM130]|uniref:autotransporter domain-containing protein n=1 Tax=Tatumella sp. JGM130 TaxID=2799797 RepID=UPI001BB09A22